MNILLLDMDGVLLEPHGYHRALVKTVSLVAWGLGFGRLRLSRAQIAAFEAAGVYSEWDSSAICAALLLKAAWQANPGARLPQIPIQPPARRLGLPAPDFGGFASRLGQPQLSGLRPLQRAGQLLVAQDGTLSAEQQQALSAILSGARAAENSLTHCIFQELVLGSQEYARIYNRPAWLDTPSYLLEYDRPLLDEAQAQALAGWSLQPGNCAVIFTSRPSSPLPGVFSTPEAELGAQRAGLHGIPIVGLGALAWLAEQRGLPPQSLVKPSPLHVLAALGLVLGLTQEDAMRLAAGLALDGQVNAAWRSLQGARLYVVEDNIVGLQSALSAQDLLHKAGIQLRLELHGISRQPLKAGALRRLAAVVSSSLPAALRRVGIPGV